MKFVRRAFIAMALASGTFFGVLIGLLSQNSYYGFITFVVISLFSILLFCMNYSGI